MDSNDKLMKKLIDPSDKLKKMMAPSLAIKAMIEPSPMMIALSKYSETMNTLRINTLPMLETQRELHRLIEPYKINFSLTQSAIVPYAGILAEISHTQAQLFSNSAVKLLSDYSSIVKTTFNPPIMSWLKDAVSSPIVDLLIGFESLIPQNFDIGQFNEIYLSAMYEARWFPYTNFDVSLTTTILDIMDETKQGKKREKLIDKVILAYYNKGVIEEIRKSWRFLDIPSYKIRILNQAIRAYHRKEYALTVSTLVSLWEGIIAQKVNEPDDYRVSRKTRQNMVKLIDENDGNEKIKSFCNEFIFYDCAKQEDVKEDVPGRHGIAHSWYDKYPKQKVALNAILFTDFLLNADPLQQD